MYVMKEKACGGDIQRRQKSCGGDIQRRLYGTADPGLCIYGVLLFNRSWTWTKKLSAFSFAQVGH